MNFLFLIKVLFGFKMDVDLFQYRRNRYLTFAEMHYSFPGDQDHGRGRQPATIGIPYLLDIASFDKSAKKDNMIFIIL